MSVNQVSTSEIQTRPYKGLKEDPKFDQIRRLIENLPPDKMGLLEQCIQRWSCGHRLGLHRSRAGIVPDSEKPVGPQTIPIQ